jgi:hypothetical protein
LTLSGTLFPPPVNNGQRIPHRKQLEVKSAFPLQKELPDASFFREHTQPKVAGAHGRFMGKI